MTFVRNDRNFALPAVTAVVTALIVALLSPAVVNAHCDTMDGPVVKAAQKALETNDVNLVLVWVQPKDEPEIRDAFARTMDVRRLGSSAADLADRYFFETLVRIHRAGEGVAYTGLVPAGAEIEPGIAAADAALESGADDELVSHLTEAVHHGLQERFTAAMAKKNFGRADLAAGREYVKAYVEFIHYAEGLFKAAASANGEVHAH